MAPRAPAAAHPASTYADGLEWFAAPASRRPPAGPASAAGPTPAHSGASSLSTPGSHGSARPLVVILPWMWAPRAAVARHVSLYHSLGCDVAVYRWPALSVWLPALAQRNADQLLASLATHIAKTPRDVVLCCMSGAAKGVLCPLLMRLAPVAEVAVQVADAAAAAAAAAIGEASGAPGAAAPATAAAPAAGEGAGTAEPPPPPQPFWWWKRLWPFNRAALPSAGSHRPPTPRPPPPPPPPKPIDPEAAMLHSRIRGILFDSSPVDFESSVGVRLFATSAVPAVRQVQHALGSAAAGTLDFVLWEMFERQRRRMWVGLRAGLADLGRPLLFLYSWNGDNHADPQPIHALAAALRGDAAARLPGVVVAAAPAATAAEPLGGSGGSACGSDASACGRGGTEAVVDGAAATAAAGAWAGATRGLGPVEGAAGAPAWVAEQAWDQSLHVAHLRQHPAQYTAAVEAFLGRCLAGAEVAGPRSGL